ncbi:unnamed protein product [Rotaria magnacalcarata]|uniref:Uncharacterized protein n=1 Tax=Rotaria magnacalcarata TaxID=392030 RepID=A0A816LNU7_9BILA|nr:unnamed protein product [Rotaria magnacalcarata]CAF1248628.1 unnamed protein product [Rotaria magnacalcarata]CAF1947626.1 unnamed protein product [Rotaria magnacalcarata]CAF3877655.1 unnamed protein product [Rotaria magnacalcarata]CAF4032832.1 unnamed protein product [Rotaria magnacalcarata]
MPIHFYFTFLLTITILIYVDAVDPIKTYSIRKDFFTGIKSGEFSIRDPSGKHLYYRIESEYSLLHTIKVIAYPSKQEIGRLKANLKPILYKADISILNPQTNQWIQGVLQQNLQLLGSSFNIDWNGDQIRMESEPVSFTSKFYDKNSNLLAQFRLQPASLFWTKKYDMEIFSTKYPEQIYFLSMAARDRIGSSKRG